MGDKYNLSGRLNSFELAPGRNPLEEMGRVGDLAAEMRTAGLTVDDHMLYTTLINGSVCRVRGGGGEPCIS